MSGQPFVEYDGASVRTPAGRPILDRLVLAVPEGETLALIGRSGPGKTTALRLVTALVRPTTGAVRVAGRHTTEWDPSACAAGPGTSSRTSACCRTSPWPGMPASSPSSKDGRPGAARPAWRSCSSWSDCRPPSTPTAIRTSSPAASASASAWHAPSRPIRRCCSSTNPSPRSIPSRGASSRTPSAAFNGSSPRRRSSSPTTCARRRASPFVSRCSPTAGYSRPAHRTSWPPTRTPPCGRSCRPERADRMGAEILAETGRHVMLVVISVGLATAIGVPLGILLTRRPGWQRLVLGTASAVQTIPSLALFGLLIPVPFIGGIGPRTALIALTLYSLLPVLRNTVVGIAGVDRAVREAGRGLGMTDAQLLRRVELPLAASVILAGIRLATVIGIGLATIAAAIGAGGL